jgi:hypothetical protein
MAFALKGAADWSLGSNLQQRPELAEALRERLPGLPAKSGAHVRLWLGRIDRERPTGEAPPEEKP